MKPKFYWFTFDCLRVTHHLLRDVRSIWTGIYGFQIGEYFIGVIRGKTENVNAFKETTNTTPPSE